MSAWAGSLLVHAVAVVAVATAVHGRSVSEARPPLAVEVLVDTGDTPPPPRPSAPAPERVADRAEPVRTTHAAAAHGAEAPRVAAHPSPPSSEPSAAPSPAAAEVVAVAAASPTFAMTLSAGDRLGSPQAGGNASPYAGARGEDAANAIFDETGVSAPATLASQPPAPYPAEARAAEFESDVPVDIVVDVTGHVVQARVARHVGYGLDEAALDTLKHTHFHPAQRHGRSVAVRMRWTMQFRLQ